jgi:hypothetical protein
MRLPLSLSLTGVLSLTAGAHALDQQGGEVEVWLHLEGTVGGERLGESLEMVGDVDGDGTPDLVVGRPFGSSGGFQFNGYVEVLSGVDGSLIHRWDGGTDFECLGSTLSARHDVDGDGVDDILIGTPDATVGVDPDAGKWILQSGATGLTIHAASGSAADERLGSGVALVGDLDGDGRSEFLVGAAGSASGAGRVDLHDGATGVLLQAFPGAAGSALGAAVAGAGDIDGDGTRDLLMGAPESDVGGFIDNGEVRVVSGATLLDLRTHEGLADSHRLGSALDGDRAIDLDDRPDYVLGAPTASALAPSGGAAFAVSGLDGSFLWRIDGQEIADNLGGCVATCGDVDGDGFGDVLVGARLVDANGLVDSGSALLVGGRDGAVLMRADGEAALDNLGRAVTGGRDFDGDGHPDIAYSAPFADPQGVALGGEVEVVRIRPILTASASEVGAAAGGVVVFAMNFPLSEVGLPYLLLASRSGVGPTPYRGASIPLTNDSLFQSMVNNPPPVFSGTAGNLDPGGDAVATLTLTPGIAAGFVGSTVHFAALSLDLGSLPSVVSNVVALAILP